MGLNPKVWMPYLWFVLYTIAIEYPKIQMISPKKSIIVSFKIYRSIFQHILWEVILQHY